MPRPRGPACPPPRRPEFINAASVSILERLRNAKADAPEGAAFTLITTDKIKDDDPLAKLLSPKDGSLRMQDLAVGKTDASRMGAVRKCWREHLKLETDEELYEVLGGFHIKDNHHDLEMLREHVSLRFRVVGLVGAETSTTFLYDDAAKQLKIKNLTNMLAAARSAMVCPIDQAPEILIDEVTVKLPVRDGDAVTMPRVLVAVMLPQRRIVAAEINSIANLTPSLIEFSRKVGAAAAHDGVRLPIRAPYLADEDLAAMGADALRGTDQEPQLSQVLGNKLGELGLLYRTSVARPGSALATARHASPLSDTEARRTIRAAIDVHNATLSG